MSNNFQEKVSFIWSIADLLRGDYKRNEYQDVILPLTVLKRLDSVLEPTKEKVLAKLAEAKKRNLENPDLLLKSAAGYSFYNTSRFTFKKLTQDPENIALNLKNYTNGFSKNMYEIVENFDFEKEIDRLDKSDLLFLVMEKFNEIDLHPDKVSNHEMGTIFEELIRKFSEQSGETAGEHFTPREVIQLMVKLIIAGNGGLETPNIIKTVYDPACGTGGMLTIAKNEIVQNVNPAAKLFLYGQELNPKTYAIAKADMLIKGEKAENIKKGNSFTEDQLPREEFDFMLTNPPFGVDWKKVAKQIRTENKDLGFDGRFGAGLPRVSDGQLLFLQHMIAKMENVENKGSRIAIVFNGSPLFTGDAGSGESEIRRWILENDWLEAIVALPDQLFYNTGIHTYIWLVANVKSEIRKGQTQLIDARELYSPMRKSLGQKRHYISDSQIEEIVKIYEKFNHQEKCKVYPNEFFGYRKITVERPLQRKVEVTDEKLKGLRDEKRILKLEKGEQEKLFAALGKFKGATYFNLSEFEKELKESLNKSGVFSSGGMINTILDGLSEHSEKAEVIKDGQGNPKADTDLRDYERVPLNEGVEEYFEREVVPFVPNAWVDKTKTKIGYEINFTRYFYKYKPLRSLEEITEDIKKIEKETDELMKELFDKSGGPHSQSPA